MEETTRPGPVVDLEAYFTAVQREVQSANLCILNDIITNDITMFIFTGHLVTARDSDSCLMNDYVCIINFCIISIIVIVINIVIIIIMTYVATAW